MPPSNLQFTSRQVLIAAIIALLLPIVWIEVEVLEYTKGVWAFPLDDTFIHMAVAKNLAFERVWGISSHSFQSASSSPLYTLILALFFLLTGNHPILPLVINLIAAIALIFAVQRWMIQQGTTPIRQLIILLLLIFLTPLPLLVISGMEHTLHLLFSFLFIYSFSASSSNSSQESRLPTSIYIYGLLAVSIRYESIFIVGIACLLLFRKHWRTAILLGFTSILPVILFGIIAISKGSYFMPNSVIIKSGVPPLTIDGLASFFSSTFWYKLFYPTIGYNLLSAQRLVILIPFFFIFFQYAIRQNKSYGQILLILMGAVLAHIAFAYYSPYPRYEAYLIGCSTPVCVLLALQYGKELLKVDLPGLRSIFYGSLIILVSPLAFRSWYTFNNAEQECINIYEQQYQMGQFVHRYYNDTPIAINDIGAVSYLSNGDKLDLFGIASIDVIKSKKEGRWSSVFADSLVHRDGVKVAIVYDRWFHPALLHRWTKVGSWQIQNNLIAGDDSVSFYSINKADTTLLRKNLNDFQKYLPVTVRVHHY